MTPQGEAQAMFRAYATSEGAWATPAWRFASNQRAQGVDPSTLRTNIVKALMEPKKDA